jgi:hypothetical protein
MEATIEVAGLRKRFGSTLALDGVDSLTCGPDLRYVSRLVFKLVCRAIADQDRHTPRIDQTAPSCDLP